MKKLLGLLLLTSFSVSALEIDEKLTVRIVKTSETKKTMMINRGIEDGLAEGDHAKFIVTAGIVARGVCVKVSPTRSVWSIYRLVNADFIVNDSVMSLKISPAVKITKDESQALVQDDTPTKPTGEPATLGIPLAEGAQDVTSTDEALQDADFKSLEDTKSPSTIVKRNKEIYLYGNLSGLGGSTKTDIGDDTYSASQFSYHFGLGGELYSRREREWYSRFSLLGEIALMGTDSQAYTGASVENSYRQVSFGTNWHPFKLPSAVNQFIPLVHASFNFGTISSEFTSGTEDVVSPTNVSTTGTSNGFALGVGYKFYASRGFGARILLDYYMRSEKYKEDINNNAHNKTSNGPRIMLGLSYRL